jgi:hypothetical protein
MNKNNLLNKLDKLSKKHDETRKKIDKLQKQEKEILNNWIILKDALLKKGILK